MVAEREHLPHWLERGSVYQIYPRSFLDSNGDGIGDLPGITSRLDYCRWLGNTSIWLSPIYPSPMADFGYDVRDHTEIDPVFGTLADFDELLAEAHRLGLKVMLDFVANHTSSEHLWFEQSRSTRQSASRDWHIWRDPGLGGVPPNNWLGEFGGSAWEWDEPTGQYYLHSYLKEQPDLNWRNPELREAMWNALRCWLERGVDGFRVDAISRLIKDEWFRDNPPNRHYTPGERPSRQLVEAFSKDQPDLHDVVREMRQVIDECPDRALVGETQLPLGRIVTYYAAGISFPFNFHLIRTDWDARAIREVIDRYEGLIPDEDWPSWILGSHDDPRVASRIGPAQARVAAMLTLRGTPILYYGDELGMRNADISPDQVQDTLGKNLPGLGLGRDPERAPMSWTPGPNAGFTRGTPWLSLTADYRDVNVETARCDPHSTLGLYRRLLEMRAAEPALQVGQYVPDVVHERGFAYRRVGEGQPFLVALNFSRQPLELPLRGPSGRIAVSTYLDREAEPVRDRLRLRGDEGVLVTVDG